ncbi:MAG: rRNA maturation RNase YbeY [Clostridiales bacterium]|nr:rRNA maturation RNase YbeY [Clostridiales bacterium]
MAKLRIECVGRRLRLDKICDAVYQTLGQKAPIKAELVFVSASEIQNLNRETRGVDKVTDVLSYPTLDGIRGKILDVKDYPTVLDDGELFIGSIVICEDKVLEQATEYGHSNRRERTYLIIHALMHLFGYDHMTDEDKKQMRDLEKSALKLLGVTD